MYTPLAMSRWTSILDNFYCWNWQCFSKLRKQLHFCNSYNEFWQSNVLIIIFEVFNDEKCWWNSDGSSSGTCNVFVEWNFQYRNDHFWGILKFLIFDFLLFALALSRTKWNFNCELAWGVYKFKIISHM